MGRKGYINCCGYIRRPRKGINLRIFLWVCSEIMVGVPDLSESPDKRSKFTELGLICSEILGSVPDLLESPDKESICPDLRWICSEILVGGSDLSESG
jgi:hypothetical protein